MKHLLEEDLLVADLSERVDMVLPEIKEETNGWINNVETHLAELIRKGREEDELDAEIPELTLPVAGDSTTDPFESVTSGQKLLLRADSLFMSNRIGGLPPPVVYDALIADGYRSQVTNPFQFMRPTKAPLDLGKFKRHPEAQAAARILLEHLGKPNATFLEMKSAGKSYMCGRCHDIITYSWEELVQHYLQHKQTWGQAQKQQGELTRRGVTFRNVHNPAFETNKPMVKIVSKEEGITAVSNLLQGMNIKACNVCHKFTFLPPVRGSEEKIIEHVRDVHNISEPKSPEHYAAPFYGLHYGSMFDVDDDMYDSYYDSDSDMWDDPFDAYDMYDMYDMYNMHGGYGGGMDSDDGSLGW
ncbi:hypothetical protein FRC07_010203 [Ceratobasidium sp. 392]|nr:hypothetical protein FRC07_010203 [Ceratobasidium sp. 392]